MTWGKEAIIEKKVQIIAILLNYDIIEQKRDKSKEITIIDKSPEGWVFLEEIMNNIPDGKKFLDKSHSYLFFNELFIECRNRKSKGNMLQYTETITMGEKGEISKKIKKKTSAYRLRRDIKGLKHLLMFIKEYENLCFTDYKDITSFHSSKFMREMNRLHSKIYDEFYDAFKLSDNNNLQISRVEYNLLKTQYAHVLSLTFKDAFIDFLGNAASTKKYIRQIMSDVFSTAHQPSFDELIMYNKFRTYMKNPEKSVKYIQYMKDVNVKIEQKYSVATKPVKKDAQARILVSQDKSPLCHPDFQNEGGEFFYIPNWW